jgi:hypothetical protein
MIHNVTIALNPVSDVKKIIVLKTVLIWHLIPDKSKEVEDLNVAEMNAVLDARNAVKDVPSEVVRDVLNAVRDVQSAVRDVLSVVIEVDQNAVIEVDQNALTKKVVEDFSVVSVSVVVIRVAKLIAEKMICPHFTALILMIVN